MNRLPKEKRAQVLKVLVEGNSMRSTARICDVAFNTVADLLDMAGKACKLYHDEHVRDIKGKRNIQCDEIWSFVYAKEKRLGEVEPLDVAGSVYLFTALDADSKLLVSYMVRKRQDTRSATKLMKDLAGRLRKRPKLTTDGLKAYPKATKKIWGIR